MIEFKHVCKSYELKGSSERVDALNDINLKISDGEFVFIVGPSGAGKSTIMKLLLHEETPTSGALIVNGADVGRLPNRKIPYYRRQFGIEFQDYKLFEKSTVYENIAFAMRAIGEPNRVIKQRVPKLLRLLSLSDRADHFPEQLSGGEQQRVSLARAMANNPRILIADEPTANIDPKMSLDVMNMLIQLNQGTRTVIVITHEKTLVDRFQKRVISLSQGEIADDRVGGMFNA